MLREGGAHVAVVFGALAVGCGAESRTAPRTPVNATNVDPTCVTAPAVQDSFPRAFTASAADDAYRAEPPPHVDLGQIGDAPIGREPSPPQVDPPWEQPFTLDRPYAGSACRCACPVVLVVVPYE